MNKKYVCPGCDRELSSDELSHDVNSYRNPSKLNGLRSCVYCGYTGSLRKFKKIDGVGV